MLLVGLLRIIMFLYAVDPVVDAQHYILRASPRGRISSYNHTDSTIGVILLAPTALG